MALATRELEIVYGSTAVADVESGNGIYNLEAGQPTGWVVVGLKIKVFGCTNSANNGVFEVTAFSGTEVTTDNSSSVTEAASPGKIGYVMGSSSGRELTNVIINTKKWEEATVEAVVDIVGTTLAIFDSEISAIEDTFATPFQDLIITQGTTELYSFQQSANTGLDAKPEITKDADNASGRGRRYGIRVVVGLPANTGAEIQTGLREHTVDVAYDAARIRTVTISGLFTAIGSSDARAQYVSAIAALETSVFSALSIEAANRELIEEPAADGTYNVKTLAFRRVWKELIFSQAGASQDNTSIKDQRLTISRLKEAPGDTPGAKRLATLSVEYDCTVDSEVSTNLKGLYEGTIRPFIIKQAKNFLGGGTVAIIEDEPGPMFDGNQISVRMKLVGTTGGTLLERTIQIEDDFHPGWVLVPVWEKPLSKYRYPGVATFKRTITDIKTVIGFVHAIPFELTDAGSGIFAGTGIGISPGPGSHVHTSSRPKFIHKRMGLKGSTTIDVTDIVKIDVFEYYLPVKGGGRTESPRSGADVESPR